MRNNLPWLSLTERDKLFSDFEKVVGNVLMARHWGVIKRAADSPSGHTQLYILDMRGLLMAAGILSYMLRSHKSKIYYRGQVTDYTHLTPSIYRSSSNLTAVERAAREARLSDRLACISTVFDINPAVPEEREALAQHYGLPTRCLDVLDHVNTAAWFAYHRTRIHPTATDAVGHIYVLAADQTEQWAKVIDLRKKPTNWLRPHMQQAHMMFTGPDSAAQTNFNYTCVAHFIVPRPLLRIWSNYDYIGEDVMLPPIPMDEGAQYWANAVSLLESSGLVSSGGPIAP